MLNGGSGPLVMIIAWNVSGHMISGNGVGPPPGAGVPFHVFDDRQL